MASTLDPQDLRIWERQRDEPPAAWFAFRRWRDMNLTFTQVADDAGVTAATIGRWAADWSWKLRKLEYDRWVDEGAQRAAVVTAETMGAEHLTMAAQMRLVASRTLRKLLDGLEVDPTSVSASAAVRMAKEAVIIDRLTLGQPTEITETTAADYSVLNNDEWDALCAYQEKAEAAARKKTES